MQTICPFPLQFIDLNIPLIENYDSNYFAISSNVGTYYSNWMAYSIQLHIDQTPRQSNLPPSSQKTNATFLASQIKNFFDLNNLI